MLFRRAVGWSALAPAARALLRLVPGRSRQVGRCQTLLARGSMRAERRWHSGCHPWRLNCPTLAGALRVGFRWSARLVKGAARAWVCLWLGAALSGSARRCAVRGGSGALPASGWLVCTGSRGARAAALGPWALAAGGRAEGAWHAARQAEKQRGACGPSYAHVQRAASRAPLTRHPGAARTEVMAEKVVELIFGLGAASYGACVDRACPGSSCDPLTCTTCCCIPTVRGARLRPCSARPGRGAAADAHVASLGVWRHPARLPAPAAQFLTQHLCERATDAQGCGVPSLLTTLGSGGEQDEAVTLLLSLPYATAAAHCMPAMLLCWMAPCVRTHAEASSVRAAVISQGVFPAALQALANAEKLHNRYEGLGWAGMTGGLQVLEQYVPFDAAGAVAAGVIPAVRQALAMVSASLVAPEVPLNANEEDFRDKCYTPYGKALIAALAASVLVTLAAFSTSGLDGATRLALAQEAASLLAPVVPIFFSPPVPWDADTASRLSTRYNNIITICNAVISSGGSPMPLLLTNPSDIPFKVWCGPTYFVNTIAESNVEGGSYTLAKLYSLQPPVRIALGAVQTVIPARQAMMQNNPNGAW